MEIEILDGMIPSADIIPGTWFPAELLRAA